MNCDIETEITAIDQQHTFMSSLLVLAAADDDDMMMNDVDDKGSDNCSIVIA